MLDYFSESKYQTKTGSVRERGNIKGTARGPERDILRNGECRARFASGDRGLPPPGGHAPEQEPEQELVCSDSTGRQQRYLVQLLPWK